MAIDTQVLLTKEFPNLMDVNKKNNQAHRFMEGVKDLIELCGDDKSDRSQVGLWAKELPSAIVFLRPLGLRLGK